jgi:tRNA(Glu) U13 pseudouridine synthase TruD
MLKTNVDSFDALTTVARCFSKKPKNLGIAGNKDKRGITIQRVTVPNASEDQIDKAQSARYFRMHCHETNPS